MSVGLGWPCSKCQHMAPSHAALEDHLMYQHPRLPSSKCAGCGVRISMNEGGAWYATQERTFWCHTDGPGPDGHGVTRVRPISTRTHRPLVIDPLLDEVQEVERDMKATLLALRAKLNG